MSRHFDRKAASGFAATVWNTYDVGQTSNVTSIFIPLTPALNTRLQNEFVQRVGNKWRYSFASKWIPIEALCSRRSSVLFSALLQHLSRMRSQTIDHKAKRIHSPFVSGVGANQKCWPSRRNLADPLPHRGNCNSLNDTTKKNAFTWLKSFNQ